MNVGYPSGLHIFIMSRLVIDSVISILKFYLNISYSLFQVFATQAIISFRFPRRNVRASIQHEIFIIHHFVCILIYLPPNSLYLFVMHLEFEILAALLY